MLNEANLQPNIKPPRLNSKPNRNPWPNAKAKQTQSSA